MLSSGRSTTVSGGSISVVAGSSTQGTPYANGGFVLLQSGDTGNGTSNAAGSVSITAGVSGTESSTGLLVLSGGATNGTSVTAGVYHSGVC